jgi:exonuclease SbcC
MQKASKVIKKHNNMSKKIIKIPFNKKPYQVLCDDDSIIKTIYHIADIHISKVDERHQEFMSVFKNLINTIRKDTRNALIVICGDILHEKNVLSPPQILLAKKFFIMLAELCPCIAIIGNHDVNPYGNTIDSISPILTNLDTVHKIHLLLEDQLYYYNNLVFGLTTMFANIVTPCDVKDKVKIGLYHGTLKNIFNKDVDQSYSFIPGKFEVDEFKKYYDYTLLGDIHKHMYLDSQKTIAYSGSLLQTRMGEDLLDHGLIKWDIETKKSNFIRVQNDCGFLKIRCDQNGLNQDDLKMMPKNPIIVMEYQNITSSDAEEQLTIIREKYNAKCSLVRIVNDKMDIKIGKGKQQIDLIKIDDNNLVMKLITNFVKTNSKLGLNDQSNLVERIRQILSTINFNYANTVKKLTIKSLKFDNFFNYGESNQIKYEGLKGIIGINGNSYVGKSTLGCDVLLYALFGECSRGDKYDTINVDKTYMSTEIEFDINGDHYRILRTREKGRSKTYNQSSEKVDMYKENILISKETVDQTNKFIRQLLCSYSDFVNIAFMMQNKTVSFIDLPDKDRKSLVCDLLKLNVFNDIVSHAKKQIAQHIYILSHMKDKIGNTKNKRDTFDKNTCINNLSKIVQRNQEEFNTIQQSLDTISQEMIKINKTKIETDMKISEFNKLYKNVLNSKTRYDININNIRKIISDTIEHQNEINVKSKEFMTKTKKLNDLEKLSTKFGNVNDMYEQFNKTNSDERKNIELQIQKISMQYTKLNKIYDIDTIKQYQLSLDVLNLNVQKHKQTIQNTKSIMIYMTKPLNLDIFYERSVQIKKQIINTTECINTITKDIEQLESKSQKLESHKFNSKCEHCMNYAVTKDKLRYCKQIKSKSSELKKYKNTLCYLSDLYDVYDRYQELYNNFYQIENNNRRHQDTITQLHNLILIDEREIDRLKNIIKSHNQNIKNYESNKLIELKNLELNRQLIDINNRHCDEYEQYKIIQQQIIVLSNDIQVIERQNDKLQLTIDRLQHDKQICESQNKTIDDIGQKLLEYEKLKKESNTINDHHSKISKLYEAKQHESKEIENTLGKTRFELNSLSELVQEYTTKEKDKALLETINQVLDKNGLIDNILSTIVSPKIESNLNQLLKHIVDYKIQITYTKGRFQINKIVGSKAVNIETLSGCEKFITDICFKIVLDQYNSYVKPGFIVMDEVFTCCDDENISKLPALFNYIKKHYDYALLISHDERIKRLYDTTIEVIKTDSGSQIVQ